MTKTPPTPDQGAAWLVLAATLALSFKPIVAKLAYGAGASVPTVLLYRFVLAVPLLWLGARLIMGQRMRLPGRADLLACLASGTLFFLSTVLDFYSVSLIGASLSRALLFTFPAIVLLVNAVRRREPPSPRQMAAFAVTYAGVLLLMQPGTAGAGPELWWGAACAMACAVTYALFWVVSQPIIARIGSPSFTVLSNGATLALLAPAALAAGGTEVLVLDGPQLGWSLLLAVACTVLPFFLLFEGLRRWGTERAAVLSLCGPAVTALAAWPLLGERFDAIQGLGLVVVTAGIAVLQNADGLLRRLLRRAEAPGA